MVRERVLAFPGTLTKDETCNGETPDHVPSISVRYQSPGLLLLGSLCSLAAFTGSTICTIMKFSKGKYKRNELLDIDYPSGLGYWPETVSESVADSSSAAGKIFFTFCLISGICLFLSWYPQNLRNVYTGPASLPFGIMYWTTFRSYVPTIGLFILIGVSVYPSNIAMETNGGVTCMLIHLTGAFMMFVGYMLAEFKCMEMFGFKLETKLKKLYLDIEGNERLLRIIFVGLMFAFYCLFCIFEVLLVVHNPCCADEWVPGGTWYNRTSPQGRISFHILEKATVVNTASSTYFYYKVGAYTGECFAGVFLVLSHLTVWYYCEERHVNHGTATLEMVYDQHTDGGYKIEDKRVRLCHEDDDDDDDDDYEEMEEGEEMENDSNQS